MRNLLILVIAISCISNNYSQTSAGYYTKVMDKFESKDYIGAIADFNKAKGLNPNQSKYYFYRGNSKFILDNPEGAIFDFNKAIKLNPNDAMSYFFKGLSRINLNYDDGCLYLSKAGELGFSDAYDAIKKHCN